MTTAARLEESMKGEGHTGITFGLVGLGSAIWMRQNLSDRLDHLSELDRGNIPSLRERVVNRAPLALAATTVTGTAAVTSGNLDNLEKALFGPGGHREIGHSLVYGLCFNKLTNRIINRFQKLAEDLCETWGLNESGLIQETHQAIADLLRFISDGAFYGQLTHLLGDLPTSGTGGVSALPALKPLLNRDISLSLIKSSSPLWNSLFWKGGCAIGVGSLVAIGAYTVAPKWPSEMVKAPVARAKELKTRMSFNSVVPFIRTLLEMTARGYNSVPICV